MSSDNPQNPEQPGEFEDLLENAPNQDPAPAATSPEGKVDPAKTQEEKIKSSHEQLERLRKERENQDEVISRLTSANTKLQEKFDVAEKRHKVQQESAVEVASKAAVREVASKAAVRQVAKERDDECKSKKIYRVVMVAAVILLCGLAAHDFLLETGPKSNTAVQQPTAASGQNTPTAANEKEEDPILKRIKTLTNPNPNAKTNK